MNLPSVDELVGKRVFLINPGGYSRYAGTVLGRVKNLEGSTLYDDWADIDWDCKVHPCTTPMEIKHLRIADKGEQNEPAKR